MARGKKPEPQHIRVERVYDAPIEDLWALWTTKDGLAEWFAPEGAPVEVPTLELRAGGAFDHVMTPAGAEQVAYMRKVGRPLITHVRGHVVEVVHHERLHLRMTIDFLPGVEPYPYDILVEFHSEAQRVRMVVTADAHPDAEMSGSLLWDWRVSCADSIRPSCNFSHLPTQTRLVARDCASQPPTE